MPRKKLTEEEKQLRQYEKEVKALRSQIEFSKLECLKVLKNIPKPCHIFKIGDRVEYGMWDYAAILDVFESGKYYKVNIITKNIQYGKYIGEQFKIVYLPWISLKPYRTIEEIKNLPSFIKNKDIKFSYSQRTIDSLLGMMFQSYSGIDMNPDYQRGLVWSIHQEIALIDSIFKNVDIGKFTFIKRPFRENEPGYEVLDGKQRLNTLSRFATGKLKYNNRTYFELAPIDQYHFKNYSISYAETDSLTPEQKYRYFLNLNTTGVPISKDHIYRIKKLLEEERKNNG